MHKARCSKPFRSDYHQLLGNHLQYHMGNISERTHSLAEDVKLSAHGRHPIAYLFTCCFIVALKLFSYCFPSFCYCCVFRDKRVLQFKFGGMLGAMPVQTVPHLPGQLFPCIYTLGTICNLSLGVWETHLHTLCLVLIQKEKKNCMFMLS
jgi:hypothetical protein